jgi:Cyclin
MAKMEKEIAIVCMVYLEKIIVKMGIYITPSNWRRLVLMSLILGSKIWDDESFENDNFATVFNKYTTDEINEMERMFIERIDYDLEIPTLEYTKYYFILRRYARKDKIGKTLRALDVATVIKL